jgi:toxin FitB
MDQWIARFPVLPADASVAQKWGEVVAYAERRGRPRPMNDSWVAGLLEVTDSLPRGGIATSRAAHPIGW